MELNKEQREAICGKRQAKNKPPKLTFKIAKALALQELGTSSGIIMHENNNRDYQRYEMRIGEYTVVIANEYEYPGIACISFAGRRTYFNISTLQENYEITDMERHKDFCEIVRDMASGNSSFLIEALIEAHGLDGCRKILDGYQKHNTAEIT